jgi:hypothetical protein
MIIDNKYYIIVAMIYLINPLLGIFCFSYFLIAKKPANKGGYYLFFLLFSIFLGLINTTKKLESDILQYSYDFYMVKNTNFLDYLGYFAKEPLFYAITYCVHILFFGSFKAYIVVLTIACYMPIFVSIYKYWIHMDYGCYLVVLITLFFGLYQEYFIWTSQVIRQCIAGAFLIYFITEKSISNKNNIFAIVIGSLIHTSTVPLFIILSIFNKNTFSNKKYLLYSFVMLSVIFVCFRYWENVLNVLSSLFGNVPFVLYGITRAIDKSFYHDLDIDANNWVIANYLMVIMCVFSVVTVFAIRNNAKAVYISFVYIAYFIYIKYLLNSEYNLLAYRMVVYAYIFLPIVLFLPFEIVQKKLTNLKNYYFAIGYSIILMSLYLFIRRFDLHGNAYSSANDILISPLIKYFL